VALVSCLTWRHASPENEKSISNEDVVPTGVSISFRQESLDCGTEVTGHIFIGFYACL
jgi:hypothetical protein